VLDEDALASPEASESRPLLLARLSFVITGPFDALRFVRFASATSGESCADTTNVASRIGINILRIHE